MISPWGREGRVTKLLIDGNNFDDLGVVSHNLHATVLESSATSSGGDDPVLVTIWNLASGRADATDRFTPRGDPALIDSPQGDEVTAIVYKKSGKNVLDGVSSRGVFHLARSSSHVTVHGRTVTWTSDGHTHSRGL
jgi:hypothetical protein